MLTTADESMSLGNKLSKLLVPVSELDEGLLVSATYDGDKRLAVLKFYDPKLERVWRWEDNTGHKPYCYTRLPMSDVEFLRSRKDIVGIEETTRLDLLSDSTVAVRKIIASDPLAIGGSPGKSVRDEIEAWEADIKYYENYVYDRKLRIGTFYSIHGGQITPLEKEMPEVVTRSLNQILSKNPGENARFIRDWAELLSQPLCSFKRIALDIEVANEEARVPDPEKADRPVIAVSFHNDVESLVYLLTKEGDSSLAGARTAYSRTVFADEVSMIRAAFSKIMDYPFLITFNGDDFDLRYLVHRAKKLGIGEGEIPVTLMRQEASLKHGVHIDLYRFFNNRSIQVYVYNNRYSDHTLNGISEAVLEKSKIEFEGNVGDLPLLELANYCLNDSQLTYELTSNHSSLMMKILLVISRIAKMPMNDVARLGVSNWIRSMLFYEHRRMGAIIPRQDELAQKGGASSEAIIKGKKYKGGLVIEPTPGVHFGVSVLDFASLLYDESIFVRKRQTGQVCRTKIGEFVERELPSGSGSAGREIGPTWDVLSFDYERQRASWKTVTAVIRHPSQSEALEVVTESGRRVKITKGHSVISLDSDGKKRTVRGSDLRIGDYLVTLSSFSAEQRDSSLDLLPYLRQLNDYEITRGGAGHGNFVFLRSKTSHRRLAVRRFLPLSSDLLWGLGYWTAEGWIQSGKYGESLAIEASSDDVQLAQSKFESAGFKSWTSKSKTLGCSNLGIAGRIDADGPSLTPTIFAGLVRTWFGDYARNKKIPDWILRLPLEMRNAFIDGYYRGDGYRQTEKQRFVANGKYKVGSHSRGLIEGLMSLGLVSGFHCVSKNLGDSESHLTWSDGSRAYKGTKRPPPELMARSEHVQSFANTPYYRSHLNAPVRYGRVSKASVETYRPQFRRFYGGNCHFEKIKEIRGIENSLPVYDISVKSSESFFSGDGILVSNSLYPSIIKVHNLSYETVNCPHEECRANRVPDTDHWVCTKRTGIESLVTGSLRDLRVGHYKPLAKAGSLSKEDRELFNTVAQGLKVILNACFTPDTFLVTPTGIKNIKDMKVGDKVVNVNPETLSVEIDRVIEVQEFPYTGEIYHFRDKRFVDLMVTPNHRFLVGDHRATSKSGAVFRTAEDLFNRTNMAIPKTREGITTRGSSTISLLRTAKELGAVVNIYPREREERLSTFFRRLAPELRAMIRSSGRVLRGPSKVDPTLRSHYRMRAVDVTEEDLDDIEKHGGKALVGLERSSQVPVRLETNDFASLCGWFVSEGNLIPTSPRVYENWNHRGASSVLITSQSFGKGNAFGLEHRREIGRLLSRLNLRYHTNSGNRKYYRVSNAIMHRWLQENCYAADTQVFHASSKRIPDFVFQSRDSIESFLESCYKGDGSNRNQEYSTTSLQLAKDMVVLLSLLGRKTKLQYEKKEGIYRVVFGNTTSKLTYSKTDIHRVVRKVPYDGTVYCVTTERNHTVIAGRGGRFVPVGQSYGVMGFETFALYCLPVAEATAAYGRDAITKTIERCKSEGISVIYSDSVTSERCVTLLDPEGRVRVEPIGVFFERFPDVFHRPDGKEEVHPTRWKTLSLDPSTGDAGWKDIGAVIRHVNSKKVYRVWDKFGSTRVTEDHSLVVQRDSERVLARPTDLLGKHLLRAPRLPTTRKIKTVDVYEALKDIKYYVEYKGRAKTIEAKADGDWVSFLWTNRKQAVRVKRYIQVGSPQFKALIELLGSYIAEGSSSTPDTASSRYCASIACSDVLWLRALQDDYNLLFDRAKASIIRSSPGTRDLTYETAGGSVMHVQYEDKAHKLQMMNKLSAAFFKGFCGQKSDGKQLPDFIFHVPDEFKVLLILNMVRGDGSRAFGPEYPPDYRAKNFRYETKSLRLVSGFSTLLLQMGVKHTLGYNPSKKTFTITTTCTEYNQKKRSPHVVEEAYDGYVYDLSVEGYHTFADSCGNVALKNTDSLFVENPHKDKVEALIKWAEHDLGVELDVEKNYRYVAFSGRKKNYFGVLQDGTPDIKGLTGKKSVSGDTPLLARVGGRTRFTTVEDAYNQHARGEVVELPTMTKDGKTLWARIDDAMAHDVNEAYVIKTSKGRVLKLSGDHSVFFVDNYGRLYCKETRAAKVGEILVGARYIPESGHSVTLDLKDILHGTFERGGLLHSVEPHSTTGIPIPRILPLTTDLAFLLGLFTAEGPTAAYHGSRSNAIDQNEEKNPEVCAALEDSWFRTFGWNIKKYRDPARRKYDLPVLYARMFREFCGSESRVKRVPEFIFDSGMEIVRAYLRGLFSGDGFSDEKRINFASISRVLVEQVGYLLTYFDLDYRIRQAHNARFDVDYYQLSIIGSSSRLRFQERIGFLQARFQKLPRTSPRNKEPLPITTDGLTFVKRRMLKRLGLSRFNHVSMHDSRFYNMGLVDRYNEVIDSLCKHADPIEAALLSSIRNMLNNKDATYDEVISIDRIPGTSKMYDFSVPGYERFVAGNLPSLLHNSQTPEFLKKAFYDCLEILGTVYAPEDFERARKEIKALLTGMVSSLRNKEIPLEQLSFNVMMGKAVSGFSGTTPQHVRAAKLLQNTGREIKAGDIISFVKTKTPPNVKPVSLARLDEVDVDKYLEYASSMFDQMLDSLGFSFDEILGSTTLDAFWS